MIFESLVYNIRLEISSFFSCKLAMINKSLQTDTIEKVNTVLSVYARGIRYDGGKPIRFTFTLCKEQGYILVGGDLENFIFSIRTIGFIDDSLYQRIRSYLIILSQQEKPTAPNFSPENMLRM